MKAFFPFVPAILAAAFFCVFLVIMSRRRARNFELLERVSLRRGGTVRRGFLFAYGTLVFPHASHEISVHSTPGSKNNPSRTRVSCSLNLGRDLSLSVVKENFFLRAFQFLGGQDIEVGNDLFDGTFRVRGDDEAAVRAILTPTVQERLLNLAPKGVLLSASPQELKFVVNTIPGDDFGYDSILDAFTAVLDAVQRWK